MGLTGTGVVMMTGLMAIFGIARAVVGIVGYVLGSIGLYSVIKRRGLKCPGFAWVPLLREYSMGKASDAARLRAGAQKSHLRIWILALSVISYAVALATAIFVISGGIGKSAEASPDDPLNGWVIIAYCLIFFVFIACSVLTCIALFNVFRSCSENYIVFTVLSVIFGFTAPFFLFAVRKKDREFRIGDAR